MGVVCIRRLSVRGHDPAPSRDPFGEHRIEQGVAPAGVVVGQHDPEALVVGAPVQGVADHPQPGDVGEPLVVARRQEPTALDDLGQPRQLDQSDGGLDVRHPVVEARLEVALDH